MPLAYAHTGTHGGVMPPDAYAFDVVMRDEIAACVAAQLSTYLAANEARNVEGCRGAWAIARGVALTFRVWPDVRAQVDYGDALEMLEG